MSIIVGAPYNGNNLGHVRIYRNNGGTWQQIGQDIDGEPHLVKVEIRFT